MSNVNHPNHYNVEGKKECIIEMEEKFGKEAVIHFCLLNAYKYLYRAKYKNNEQEDIQKAQWYIDYGKKLQNKDFDTLYLEV